MIHSLCLDLLLGMATLIATVVTVPGAQGFYPRASGYRKVFQQQRFARSLHSDSVVTYSCLSKEEKNRATDDFLGDNGVFIERRH